MSSGKLLEFGHKILDLLRKLRQKPGTTKKNCTRNPEVYEAEVERRNELDGSWVPKSGNRGKTSIFPSSWTKARTLEEVAYAYMKVLDNPSQTFSSGNEYHAFSFDGLVDIHMYLSPFPNIKSAFPMILP